MKSPPRALTPTQRIGGALNNMDKYVKFTRDVKENSLAVSRTSRKQDPKREEFRNKRHSISIPFEDSQV